MNPNPTRSIIIIEDNPMDLDLTVRAFQKHHLANPLVLLRDGEEAIDFVGQATLDDQKPALILLDLNLPKVDGLDVLLKIRKDSCYSDVPVVILTTSKEDRDIKRAYELGANSYIVKPVNFDSFIDVASHIRLYWLLINTTPA